jgi:hypothetical protein
MKKIIIGMALSLGLSTSAHAFGLVDFGVSAGASWGLGKMKNSTESTASRTMNTFGVLVLPGYKALGMLLVGPEFEYRVVGQNTEPSEVSNTNLKGNGYLLGLGAKFYLLNFVFSGGFDFIGKHTQSLKTTSNLESSFSKPIGFRLGVGRFEF